MINTLVPFMVADLQLPRSATPTLLAAFHPGYISSQVPFAAVVAQKGPKFVAAIQLAGSAVLLSLIPRAGNVGGRPAVLAMSALMLGMGVFQGPMSPVQSQLSRDWMPEGIERAWAYRILSLSHSSTPLLAAVLTPRIADRFGWRFVCYLFAAVAGGFTLVWQALASDVPGAAKKPQRTEAAGAEDSAPKKAKKAFDWRILRTKPAMALFACHVAADFGEFTRHQLAP